MGHRLVAPPYLVLLRVGFSLSRECRHRGGALLPHLFTLTSIVERPLRGALVFAAVSLSVALSLGSPPLAVNQHTALVVT